MPHEINEFIKKVSSTLLKNTTGFVKKLCFVGKVSNIQRFISLEEINVSRLLRNIIFILTRNSCISVLRMYYKSTPDTPKLEMDSSNI